MTVKDKISPSEGGSQYDKRVVVDRLLDEKRRKVDQFSQLELAEKLFRILFPNTNAGVSYTLAGERTEIARTRSYSPKRSHIALTFYASKNRLKRPLDYSLTNVEQPYEWQKPLTLRGNKAAVKVTSTRRLYDDSNVLGDLLRDIQKGHKDSSPQPKIAHYADGIRLELSKDDFKMGVPVGDQLLVGLHFRPIIELKGQPSEFNHGLVAFVLAPK